VLLKRVLKPQHNLFEHKGIALHEGSKDSDKIPSQKLVTRIGRQLLAATFSIMTELVCHSFQVPKVGEDFLHFL
jgi:hypothetical protein